jgi:nitrogen fixation NifU-like protein
VGVVDNYEGKSVTGDPDCGDFLEVTIRVDEKAQEVSLVRFRCQGCPAAIASSSMMTTLVQRRNINEILCLTEADIVRELGGLPEKKLHCSVLGIQAIRDAIADYLIYSMMLQQGMVQNRAQYESILNGKRITMGTHVCDGTCQAMDEAESLSGNVYGDIPKRA